MDVYLWKWMYDVCTSTYNVWKCRHKSGLSSTMCPQMSFMHMYGNAYIMSRYEYVFLKVAATQLKGNISFFLFSGKSNRVNQHTIGVIST